jgi:2,3-bisphosphoglycerate-independent phosphoglycerate mutase
MTEYDKEMPNVHVAFQPEDINNTFGECVSKEGLRQLRIAETEKYAHVTFFFNGGRELKYDLEDRILVPSPKVATYDMKPEMSAYEVCDKVVDAIEKNIYSSIILNFANTDMVGHTGVLEAAIKAVETVDECIGKVLDAIDKVGGVLLVTADHGNCEKMIDYETGKAHTAHTTNLVPFVIYGAGDFKLKHGKLCDIAPTMLDIMNIEKPSDMTGTSLIVK